MEDRHLDSLVFSGTKLEGGAVAALGSALHDGVFHADNLIFWNNGVDSTEHQSSEGVFALAEIVRSDSASLKELHFTDNMLLDDGADELGSALQEADDISKVVLSGSGITADGVHALCIKLANTAIQSLSITGVERGA